MTKLLLIGAGNMGGALIKGALSSGALNASETYIMDNDTEKVKALQKEYGVQLGNPGNAEVILLAVKPQSIESVFPVEAQKDALLISVLAGMPTEKLTSLSGFDQICRVMPNTPALVNAGASGLFFTPEVSEEKKQVARDIFTGCGEIIEGDEEDQMHAITALSGSGPAYYFQFVEHMITAGKSLGLSEGIAKKLALQTFFGAAELLKKSGESPEDLRKKVTSPGGTTFAALEKFRELDFETIVQKALNAAEKRSRELGE